VQQLTAGTALQVSPAAAAGGRLAFASRSVSTHIWSAPVEAASGAQAGPMKPLTEGNTSDMLPSLSRDGRRLVFRRSRAGGFDLWYRDLTEGRARPLTSGANVTGPMALSPDGREVAYIVLEDGRPSLYVADVRVGAPRKICDGCLSPNSTLSWHSDGKKLIYASPGTESWIMHELDTGTTSVLLRTAQTPGADLRLSPDNRWAVFHTIIDTVRRQLFVAPIRTGAVAEPSEWIPITDGTAMDRVASWSGDGSLLYFQSDRDGSRCIWAQRLEPATKRPHGTAWALIHLHSARNSLMNLSITTPLAVGGNALVFSLGEITGDVWMMDPRVD
jgi:Tol biopolymer transport system component